MSNVTWISRCYDESIDWQRALFTLWIRSNFGRLFFFKIPLPIHSRNFYLFWFSRFMVRNSWYYTHSEGKGFFYCEEWKKKGGREREKGYLYISMMIIFYVLINKHIYRSPVLLLWLLCGSARTDMCFVWFSSFLLSLSLHHLGSILESQNKRKMGLSSSSILYQNARDLSDCFANLIVCLIISDLRLRKRAVLCFGTRLFKWAPM